MNLCRVEKTESCLSPLDSAYQLSPLKEKWAKYFVFTFVSAPGALLQCQVPHLVLGRHCRHR